MKPLINLTKKQKQKIKLIFENLTQDVSYRYGGWLWLFGKFMWNAVLMWLFFGFIQSWYYFVFKDVGITEPDLQVLRSILWAIGLIWVVILGLRSSKK